MLLIVLGVVLLVAKLAEVGPPAAWPWWGVLLPFAGAAVWWMIADSTGFTRKKAMDKMDAKKQERRRKNMEALGLTHRGTKDPKQTAEQRARALLAAKVEGKRAQKREANEEVIRNSVLDSRISSRIDGHHEEPKL